MQIDIHVLAEDRKDFDYSFSCFAHLTKDENSRLIERDFYEKWVPNAIPQGEHYELELLTLINSSSNTAEGFHVHYNPNTGKRFVCWTGHLPTIEAAQTLFKAWCVGVTYTVIHERNFGLLFKSSIPEFLELMKMDYKIYAV